MTFSSLDLMHARAEDLMYSIDDLEQALDNTRRLVGGVRPDQWQQATPCAEWDVRGLVNHTTWVVQMFGTALQGREPASPRGADVLGDDPTATFKEAADTTLRAWKAHGTDGTLRIPVGELPAAGGLGINMVDVYVHGWDLARATGQDPQLDAALCTELFAFTQQLLKPELRGNAFAEPLDIDAGAPVVDRFLAFTGRQP